MRCFTVKCIETLSQPLARLCDSIKLKQDGTQMLQTGCSAGGLPILQGTNGIHSVTLLCMSMGQIPHPSQLMSRCCRWAAMLHALIHHFKGCKKEHQPCLNPWYHADAANGLQRWRIAYIAGTNGIYSVTLPCGHAACNQYLSCAADCGNTGSDLYYQDDGSGRQQWQVKVLAT